MSFREPRPRLCPACRTLVGSSTSRCHECGASLTFSLAAASRSIAGLLPGSSPATYSILGLNLALFAVGLLATMEAARGLSLLGGLDASVLQRMGASLPWLYNTQQPWRLVMAVFLHGGLLHLAMNCWVLMDVGPIVEEVYGSARFLFLYLLAGAAGFVFSSLGSHFSVGASGALMGLIGAMLALTRRRGGAYMREVRASLVRWLIYMGIFGLIVPGIDNLAHLGGLAAGFLSAHVMADGPPGTAAARQRAYLLGWIAGLAIASSLLAMVLGQSAGGA